MWVTHLQIRPHSSSAPTAALVKVVGDRRGFILPSVASSSAVSNDRGAHRGGDVAEHLAALTEARRRLPRPAPWRRRLAPWRQQAVSFFFYFLAIGD